MMKRHISLFILFLLPLVRAHAQTLQPQDDTQSWNDLLITVPLNKHFEFLGGITGRFGSDISQLNDARFGAGINWKVTKSITILPFYWNIHMRNALNQFRTEHRYSVRVSYKFPFKSFGLTHRSTYEYRGRSVNSCRYRGGMLIEKDLPKTWIKGAKFLLGDEVFTIPCLNAF